MVQGKAQFFDGHKGFQQHVVKFHKVAKFEPLKHCRYKELTEDEAEQRSREYTRGITGTLHHNGIARGLLTMGWCPSRYCSSAC
jgi:hypothetical protein